MKTNFTVIYSFQIYDGKDQEFLEAWRNLTELIYEFKGSLGSRIHKLNDSTFIAYAVWPDRETFYDTQNELPEIAESFRTSMRNSCVKIETIYEMQIVEDLVKSKPFIS